MATNYKHEDKFGETQFTNAPLPPITYIEVKSTWDQAVFWAAVTAAEVFGLACVALMVVWTVIELGGLGWTGSPKQFNVHPLLLAIGLIYLYGNALLVFRVLSNFFPNFPKLWLKVLHASLHASASIATIVGMVAVFEYKKSVKKDDLYSLHSWIGISTIGLFGLQYILGLCAFFLPWTPVSWRAKLLPFHTFFGVGIFVLSIGSALTGMMEKLLWTTGYGSTNFTAAGAIGNVYGLLLPIFGFLVVFIVVKEKYKRQPRPEDAQGSSSKYVVN